MKGAVRMAHVTFAGQVRRARERWTAALLAAGVILVLWDPAVAADAALKFLLKKGIITQSEYDEAIREARDRGFLEADPTLDVSGQDAAQKLSVRSSAMAFPPTIII